ncbi:MAG: MBL fold metallo-hydrolase [Rhodospirillaceae bacterium]|nr:MBL fold metallo-hydrolase [Rhodospirillaceae bacterium]|tara:strand:+ start:2609 stop:3472 length:864 start_codon:yes stop_codon:yes gene_type:complete
MNTSIKTFFDNETNNATHVVFDENAKSCAVIDSVLNFDFAAGKTSTEAADAVIDFIGGAELTVEWILETHIHADHLTAAAHLKDRLGGKTGIGAGVVDVQKTFSQIYGLGDEFTPDGSQFDHLFADGESFKIGDLDARVIHTPGHTPACATYVIGDAAFTGDTFFMPDSGTARCDFPGGSADDLYSSLQKILDLPPETRLFLNHDYGCGGSRDCSWETTVAEQRDANIHVGAGKPAEEFIEMRTGRDATLSMPRLVLPAIQVNMRAGQMPPPDADGNRFLKIPLNAF